VFGAAAAAASARGVDAATAGNALGIAGSFASGIMEFLADGSETKRLHGGWAAQGGITAVRLAVHGGTGPATVLEGKNGFYATYLHGEPHHIEDEVATLGQQWVTNDIAFKLYPACHYNSAPIEAFTAILDEHPIRPEEIVSITGYTDETGVGLVCAPAADKVRPRSPYDAKFSLPYCLSTLVVHGKVDITSFLRENITDEAVLALTPRVGYEMHQYAPSPDSFGGGVRVELADGRVYENEIRHQRGGSLNPLSDGEVIAKFRANAGLALGSANVSRLESAILGLATEPDLGFTRLLAGAKVG
jgi:2-methylcitrate dehydratase PrpD